MHTFFNQFDGVAESGLDDFSAVVAHPDCSSARETKTGLATMPREKPNAPRPQPETSRPIDIPRL